MRNIIIYNVTMVCSTLAAVTLLFMILNCANLTGGGSEAGNARVVGKVVDEQGVPAGSTIVRIASSTYDPVKDGPVAETYTTAPDGLYQFTVPKGSVYTIQAVQMISRTRGLAPEMEIRNSDITVPSCTLKVPGAVKIMLPDSTDAANGYVYIPGTDIAAFLTNNNGFAMLDSVPAGLLPSINYAKKNGTAPIVIRYDIQAKSGDTVTIINPDWNYATVVTINTSASGANITEKVNGFPLLVRLNAANFDFSQAKADGADIRFAKPDATPLPYEIERWDPDQRQAEVWVQVDTIFGNNAAQSIQMFWGNSQATAQSDGNAVFSMTNGWAGVWHLSEGAPDTVTGALYRNSVENANHGDDRVIASDKTGHIGKGQYLQKGDRIRVPAATTVLKPQQVTLSAWVRIFQTDFRATEVASMGDNYMLRVNTMGGAKFVLYNLLDTLEIVCEDNLVNVVDSSWHYLSGSFDGSEIRLYVDGALRKTVSYTGTIPYSRGPNFVIGNHGYGDLGFDFTGNIDEVECSSVVHSADWIKLFYETQKTGSSVVLIQ